MEVMAQKMSLAQETFEDRRKLHEEIPWRNKILRTDDEEMKKNLYGGATTVRNLEGDISGDKSTS
jgi:hypothetical protein